MPSDKMTGTLFVVGTPIGNLGDISPRALETLQNCDFIAAEDTRVTLKLLNRFEIKKPMVSYFEHNRFERGPIIAERLLSGESCALVTDAGMPAISDPGEDLVKLCIEKGIKVESVPGPCAFATALAVSGMPSRRFSFEGFLPVEKSARREHISWLVGETRTMIFYEAPHKLINTLENIKEILGDRIIVLATFAKDYGAAENNKFYELKNHELELVLDSDYSFYNAVGSDCRYGKYKNYLKVDGHVYFISA